MALEHVLHVTPSGDPGLMVSLAHAAMARGREKILLTTAQDKLMKQDTSCPWGEIIALTGSSCVCFCFLKLVPSVSILEEKNDCIFFNK